MNKRTWHYLQNPAIYDMACDICGGTNIEWSEYEGMIWCYDCQIDTPGFPGIFDGPIPLKMSAMLGISFDRFNMETNKIERFIEDEKGTYWISEEEYQSRRALKALNGEKFTDFEDYFKEASGKIKLVPASEEEKEDFLKEVLQWSNCSKDEKL